MKRRLSISSVSPPVDDSPPPKRAASSTTITSTLNAFFPTTSRPAPPHPLVHSDPITDRSSTFIAHAAPCTNSVQAVQLQAYVRALRTTSHPKECDHEMLGWRTMSLKAGRTGLDGDDDWTVKQGGDDDGEKGGARTIQECIVREGGIDVAVVVSRLYGGIMLGPVRFQHIALVATQALQRLSAAQLLPALLDRLSALDAEIESFQPPSASPEKVKQSEKARYAGLDVSKAERLVVAREKRLELLKKKQREQEEKLWREVEKEGKRAAKGAGKSANGAEEEQEEEGPTCEPDEEDQPAVHVEAPPAPTGDSDDDADEAALWSQLGSDTAAVLPVSAGLDGLDGLPDEEEAALAAAELHHRTNSAAEAAGKAKGGKVADGLVQEEEWAL
ncbi:hypothetical protein JCM21900_001878 [Sporobolomyces salmonicolor]